MEGEEKEEALKAWKDEKDYEVFDELPFWANGQGIVNKKRTRLVVYDMEIGDAKIVSPEYDMWRLLDRGRKQGPFHFQPLYR